MTALLQKAFEKASSLPEKDQDSFAKFLIVEIDDETEWEMSFASSQEELECMAKTALAEHKTGNTRPMDFSRDF
jgi:hypothetical protein